jgi:hypothetical protein
MPLNTLLNNIVEILKKSDISLIMFTHHLEVLLSELLVFGRIGGMF